MMFQFITRALTSIILGTMVFGAILYLSPVQLSIVIACIYGYALIAEFIPLAWRSRHTALFATLATGVALITTAILHVSWAAEALYLYLYICISTAVLSDVGGYIVGNLFGKNLLVPTISPKKNMGRPCRKRLTYQRCFFCHY